MAKNTVDPLMQLWSEHPDMDLWEPKGTQRVDAKSSAPAPVSDNLDNHVGGTYAGLPILDLEGVKEHIDSGTMVNVANGTITYSFTDLDHLTGLYGNPTLGFGAGYGFSP